MKFRNPDNGYIEEKSVPWLWAFLFGGLYFIANGLWAATIIWVLIAGVLYGLMGEPAILLFFFIHFVYAAYAPELVRGAYLKKGWAAVGDDAKTEATLSPAVDRENKKCPFCAETIKTEAIKCRYCGSDLPTQAKPDA